MDQQRYLINGRVFSEQDPDLQDALARIHDTPVRLKCLCVPGGVEMYVSKFRDFVIKRMPETGFKHHPSCPSYEPPAGESGLGEVLGEAIIERSPGVVELRVEFPLTRRLGRSALTGGRQPRDEVEFTRKKLTLRGVLHFLWERAGFNRWYPRMAGKRTYWVLRKYLLQAAHEVETKGLRLSERLFIPETFSPERAEEIAGRRDESLSILVSPDEAAQFKMMVALGELKEFRESTVGYKLVLKHLPDCGFFLDRKGGERTRKAFEEAFLAWEAGKVKLVVACLFFAKREHLYQVDTVTVMMVSEQWIPLDHAYEAELVAKMVAEERAFLKPLRYEAANAGAFPNLRLLDTGDRPVALDIVSPFIAERERQAKQKAIAERDPKGWVWDTGANVVPPTLPPRVPHHRAESGRTGPDQVPAVARVTDGV